jgi:hypothetical protein
MPTLRLWGRLMARLVDFAKLIDEPGRLTRVFCHRRATQAYIGWCVETGLEARIDAAGKVASRYHTL